MVISHARSIIPLTLIQDLMGGLGTDGVLAKLDRLWIFAQPTEASALTDLIIGAQASNPVAAPFTPNKGFKGNGSSQYIETNFDPSIAASPHYVRDSACLFVWSNTPGAENGSLVGTTGADRATIYQEFGDTTCYWTVNDSNLMTPVNTDAATGLYLANRTASNSQTLDINGGQFDSSADASTGDTSGTFQVLHDGAWWSSRQVCCFGCGGGLTPTDRTNLYTRLRTYMTIVGVP